MRLRLLGILAIAAIAGWLLLDRAPHGGVPNAVGDLDYPGYRVRTLEAFEVDARVLSREDYRFGREADLSPVDLAIGWGPMADPAVLQHIQISQRNRWYYWKARELPIPRGEIVSHSANVHIIPASEQVAAALAGIDVGDEVRLGGSLVAVNATDGWHWVSSLSRTDTGNGSCELLWLTSLQQL